MGKIDGQDANRGTPDGGAAYEDGTVPTEMPSPTVLPGME